MLEQIKHTAAFIQERIAGFRPEVGIILGTGLGGLVEHIDVKHAVEYADIPDFPVSTVEGHRGRLIFGLLGGRRIVAMQGRFHYYEGYTPQQVVFPVRVMKMLGIERLFVSNASGGTNPTFRVGDLMVITDHINLIPNPLIGRNLDELGPRFPDMKHAYDPALIALATEIAGRERIKLQYGCYVGLTGPTFETPHEYGYVHHAGDHCGAPHGAALLRRLHHHRPGFGRVGVARDRAAAGSSGGGRDVPPLHRHAGTAGLNNGQAVTAGGPAPERGLTGRSLENIKQKRKAYDQ